jgi:hypothetical protein
MTMLTLAQDATGFSLSQLIDDMATWLDIFNNPERLIESLAQLPLVIGAVLVVVGGLCVVNGYRWHRWVVIVLAAMGGLGIGHMLSQQMGRSHILAVAIGLLCAVIATPLLRFSVAIFGGLAGAFVGANAWTALNNGAADTHWAGAAMGFILLAMAAFILFRLVVMFFTSIGGAAMLVCGAITLLLHVEGWAPGVRDHLSTNQLLLPILVGIGAIAGFVLQESQFKQKGSGAPAKHA